jgi:hypothetical protein
MSVNEKRDSAPVEVFRITTENAEAVAEALGMEKPLVMVDAPDMVWVRVAGPSSPPDGK